MYAHVFMYDNLIRLICHELPAMPMQGDANANAGKRLDFKRPLPKIHSPLGTLIRRESTWISTLQRMYGQESSPVWTERCTAGSGPPREDADVHEAKQSEAKRISGAEGFFLPPSTVSLLLRPFLLLLLFPYPSSSFLLLLRLKRRGWKRSLTLLQVPFFYLTFTARRSLPRVIISC